MKKYYSILVFLFLVFHAKAQIVTIPDANFKNVLLNGVGIWMGSVQGTPDANANGEIELSEALTVTNIRITTNQQISSLTGIQSFTNLQGLWVNYNPIVTLDLTGQTQLVNIHVESDQLTSILGLNQQVNLYELFCSNNALTSLDVSGFTQLKYLNCDHNAITSLDVSSSTQLQQLVCNNNQLTSLQLNTNLTPSIGIKCQYNQLSTLELGHLKLQGFNCSHNQLTHINISQIGMLYDSADFSDNLITSLEFPNYPIEQYGSYNLNNNPNLQHVSMKNGRSDIIPLTEIGGNYVYYNFSNTPSLQFVCVDNIPDEITRVTNAVANPNVIISSFCSFNPGDNYSTITGNLVFDCGGVNLPMINKRVNITNTTQTGATFSNDNGSYTAYVGVGSYSVSPNINPNYFTVSPANYTCNFSTTATTQTAHFCITPNGYHPDLEISAVPLDNARPGFNSNYLLTITNNGNQLQSVSVLFTFDGAVFTHVSSNPWADLTANAVSWYVQNLAPGESRDMQLTLHLNAPQDIPAVSIGDLKTFHAEIYSILEDDTPVNNAMDFNQTVVGSYDPNDKIVVEGSQIGIDKIGDYLHYIVRFQNTGTAVAENIIIKDMLDANLDWSTLEMVSSSHLFRSTLTLGNKLGVFYEGINLPPSSVDEEGSHGYIAYKIKPKSTLVLNDVISNTANIYFDFNFPIVTNTVSTTITALGTLAFSLGKSCILYPNPASNVLNVSSNESIKNIIITNALGQTVLISSEKAIDISLLKAGTYFVIIETHASKTTQKFIKL